GANTKRDSKKFCMVREPPSGPVILDMSPPRPPLPSKRLVIRSRKAPAQWSGGLFFSANQHDARARLFSGAGHSAKQPREQPPLRPARQHFGELRRIVRLFEHRPHFGDLRR